MKVENVIRFLIKYRFHYLAYFFLSILSILLGRFSIFKFVENDLWLQKQGKIFFCDYSPNYRLKQDKINRFSNEIFFNSYQPEKGDICIDIGAGLGLETRLMSNMIGHEGRVFAIEATERTYKALENCVYYNNLNNVTLSHCAITNRKGPVKIADDIGHHTENKLILDEQSRHTTVNGLTIDQYLEDHNIEHVDYMKINIEGAEKLVIEEFKKIKVVKNIAISSHDFLGLRTGDSSYFTKDLILDFLEKNNFEYYMRDTGIDYKDGWIYGINKEFITKRD